MGLGNLYSRARRVNFGGGVQQDEVNRSILSLHNDRPLGEVKRPVVVSGETVSVGFGELVRASATTADVNILLPKIEESDIGRVLFICNVEPSAYSNIVVYPFNDVGVDAVTIEGAASISWSTAGRGVLLIAVSKTMWIWP